MEINEHGEELILFEGGLVDEETTRMTSTNKLRPMRSLAHPAKKDGLPLS